MKKLLFVIGLIAISSTLFAQGRGKGNGQMKANAATRIEEYKERLNLTDEQFEQIKEIRKKYQPEIKAVREDESKSREDKKAAVSEVAAKRDGEMEALLDEEQMAELKVIREERKEKVQEKRGKGKGRMKKDDSQP